MHYQQIKPTPSANKHSPLPALFFSFTAHRNTHTHTTALGTDCMENLLAPRLKFQSKYCVGFPCRILFENCKRKVQKQGRRKNRNDSAAFVNGFAPLRLHFGIFIGKGCWREKECGRGMNEILAQPQNKYNKRDSQSFAGASAAVAAAPPMKHQIYNIIAPCWTFIFATHLRPQPRAQPILPFAMACRTFWQLFKAANKLRIRQVAHRPAQWLMPHNNLKPQFASTIFSQTNFAAVAGLANPLSLFFAGYFIARYLWIHRSSPRSSYLISLPYFSPNSFAVKILVIDPRVYGKLYWFYSSKLYVARQLTLSMFFRLFSSTFVVCFFYYRLLNAQLPLHLFLLCLQQIIRGVFS